MVFGEKLSNEMSGSRGIALGEGVFDSALNSSRQLYPLTSSNSDAKNALRFVNCMRNVAGSTLTLFGEKEITNVIYVCRIGNPEFNHTNNFSIISGSGRNPIGDTGRKNGFISGSGGSNPVSTMDGNPQSYITQVHLFIQDGVQVVTAALSKPILKNFDREVVIKIKLEF